MNNPFSVLLFGTQAERLNDRTARFLRASERWKPYDSEKKSQWIKAARSLLRLIAETAGEKPSEVRTNMAGIAVSGDVTLSMPQWNVYVCASIGGVDLPLYLRGCDGLDPTGVSMQYPNLWPVTAHGRFGIDSRAYANSLGLLMLGLADEAVRRTAAARIA